MTTYTTSLRLWQGTPGDPAIRNAWGTFLNTDFSLIDSSITGLSTVNIAGLTTYSLTTGNGTADQARELMQDYTGALTGDCTVTLPAVQKVGWARNSTTGGHNVLLNSGGGADATLPPDAVWYLYWVSGTTVSLASVGFGVLHVSGALTPGGGLTNIQGSANFTVGTFAGLPTVNFAANNYIQYNGSGTINIGATSSVGVIAQLTVTGGAIISNGLSVPTGNLVVTSGSVSGGTGYRTSTGAGVITAHSFNINWTGSQADLYIDGIRVGKIQLV